MTRMGRNLFRPGSGGEAARGPRARSRRRSRRAASSAASVRASSAPRQRPRTVLVLPTSTARSGCRRPPAAHHRGDLSGGDDRLARRGLEPQETGRVEPEVLRPRSPRRCAGSSARSPGRCSEASSHARTSSLQRGAASSAVEPVEQRLQQRRQRDAPARLLLERRRAGDAEIAGAAEHVDSDSDRDVGVVALRARLGDDARRACGGRRRGRWATSATPRRRFPRAGPRAATARPRSARSRAARPRSAGRTTVR